ncbi:MAG TPA: MFS transporter [Streptosporangiaceae bacterium]|nr:MFS transporter [Streptosporangiaceae bacterium]
MRLGLLATRDFRVLWSGETTSCLGSSIGGVALPLVALGALHASVFEVSALTAAAWLPWVLIGLPAGAWVDRLPRRPVMITADLVSLTAFASVPVAAWCGVLTIAQLLVVALAGGVSAVFFKTAYRAFLPAVLGPDELLEGNAKLQGSEQVTNVAGPGLAGLIAQAAGAVCGTLADAVSFGVSALCLLRLRASEERPPATGRHLRREIAEGMRIVIRDPLLRVNTVFGCLSNLVLVGYQSVLVVFLIRVIGLSAGITGLLLALTSLGGVLGALAARRAAARFGTARVALYGKLLLSPAGLLIPLTSRGPGLILFLAGSVIIVAGIIAGNIVWSGWVQTYYPARLLGRLSTSSQVVNYGAIPLGAVLAGLIASRLGIRPALWVMLGGLVISSLVLLTGPLRTMRDLPDPDYVGEEVPACDRVTGASTGRVPDRTTSA